MKNKMLQNSVIIREVAELSVNHKPALVSSWETTHSVQGQKILKEWQAAYDGAPPFQWVSDGIAVASTIAILWTLYLSFFTRQLDDLMGSLKIPVQVFFALTLLVALYRMVTWSTSLRAALKIGSQGKKALEALHLGIFTLNDELSVQIKSFVRLSETDLKASGKELLKALAADVMAYESTEDLPRRMVAKARFERVYNALEQLGTVSGGYEQFFRAVVW